MESTSSRKSCFYPRVKIGFKMDVTMIMLMMIIEIFNILLYKVLNGKHRGCHKLMQPG